MHKIVSHLTLGLFIFTLWITYVYNMGQSNIFIEIVRNTPYGDKIVHVLLFGLLTLGMNISTRHRAITVLNFRLLLGTLLVVAFALIEESSQYFLSTRTMEYLDLAADAAGIALFTFISVMLRDKYIATKQ